MDKLWQTVKLFALLVCAGSTPALGQGDPKPFAREWFPGDVAGLHMAASVASGYMWGELLGVQSPLGKAALGSLGQMAVNEVAQVLNGGRNDWPDKAADAWDWQAGWVLAVALACKHRRDPFLTCAWQTGLAGAVWYAGWYALQPARNTR